MKIKKKEDEDESRSMYLKLFITSLQFYLDLVTNL